MDVAEVFRLTPQHLQIKFLKIAPPSSFSVYSKLACVTANQKFPKILKGDMKETAVTLAGTVVGTNRGSATVELDNGSVIRGIIAGRLMQHRIKVVVGDRVEVEMTPYDLSKRPDHLSAQVISDTAKPPGSSPAALPFPQTTQVRGSHCLGLSNWSAS